MPSSLPANDIEATGVYGPTKVYSGDFGPITGADLQRIEALPLGLQAGAGALLATLDAAALDKDPHALRVLEDVARLVIKEPLTKNGDRLRVLDALRGKPRAWRGVANLPMRSILGRIEPAFGTLTEEAFEDCRRADLYGFAAALACHCGAFGDRDVRRSLIAFERAVRDARPRIKRDDKV
jgi:hypothetical protein